MEKVSAMILSGGKSSRMGEDKANLLYHGRTFAEGIIDSLHEADEILLSVAHKDDYPDIKLPHISDLYPYCGPMGGIYSGLMACAQPWLFVVACDMPFFTSDVLKQLIAIKDQCKVSEDPDAMIPVSADGRIQPLCGLYHKRSAAVFKEFLNKGEYRIQDAFLKMRIHYVSTAELTGDKDTFRNINTREDYKEMIQ